MWQEQINAESSVWRGLQGYIEQRKSELTSICLSLKSSDAEIRAAQAGVEELNRVLSVPDMIKATTQMRGHTDRKNGY
jgi:hypothetical protein